MPCDFETARTETMTLFNDAWSAPGESADIPVKWPNVASDLDQTQVDDTNNAPKWARFTMEYTDGNGTSIGGGRWQFDGLITFEIYVPTGDNDKLALRLAKIIVNAQRNITTAGGVEFHRIRPRIVGNEGLWYRVDVLSEFKHIEGV